MHPLLYGSVHKQSMLCSLFYCHTAHLKADYVPLVIIIMPLSQLCSV